MPLEKKMLRKKNIFIFRIFSQIQLSKLKMERPNLQIMTFLKFNCEDKLGFEFE
jgi:hypothetical protein